MSGLALIAACLLIGIALARSKKYPGDLSETLANVAIHVSLPALVLKHLHGLPIKPDVLMPSLMPLGVFALTVGLVLLASRFISLNRPTIGCLILVCGTGNTSIVGIPLVQAFIGQEAIAYAVVADQANFIVMSVLGLSAANIYALQDQRRLSLLRRMVTYPPAIAMLAAIVLRPVAFPQWFDDVLTALAMTLTPLAIISVGAGMRLSHLSEHRGLFIGGVALKLLIAPAVIFTAYRLLGGRLDDAAFSASVLQAGMPPMIVAGLIAVNQKLNPPLAMALISFGIPLSFLSVFLWSLLF